jgi:hypothetical protein
MEKREPFFPNARGTLYMVGGVIAGIYVFGLSAVADFSPIVSIVFGIGAFVAFTFSGGLLPIINWIVFPLSAFLMAPPSTPVFYLGIGVGMGAFMIFILTQFRPVVSDR